MKKQKSKNIIIFTICFILFGVVVMFADSSEILSNFKEKEATLLFESDVNLGDFSAQDLFKTSNKISIFNNIKEKVAKKRKELEEKSSLLEGDIESLEISIKNLDNDVDLLRRQVNKTNSDIYNVKKDIGKNQSRIGFLTKTVDMNKKILIDYIVYLYKKSNLIIKEGTIDNIKAILMTGSDMDELLNDLYFKNLIGIAGKNLINKYKRNIAELYVEKKDLEQLSTSLQNLRKHQVIKKKLINDKLEYKKTLLALSKKKNFVYKKYIGDKIKLEKDLSMKMFKQKQEFFSISKDLLGQQGCKFIKDVTNASSSTSKKCIELNKMLHSEFKLKSFNKKKINKFNWPIVPINGISSFYHDIEYRNLFGVEHDAIDIVAKQGTPILAPADGYVIYLSKPDSSDYSFLALKHADGFITVYGHLSEILVEKYDFVKSGDIFAKSGGEVGSMGAGVMTTGPHLHFEIFQNKVIVDPLNYLNLALLSYNELPGKYKMKYKVDYKEKTGLKFNEILAKGAKVFKISGKNEVERQKSLLANYAREDFSDWNMWIEESLDWAIDPTFMMCIGLAESSLGYNLKTPYNVGNIGNTDSGGTWDFNSARDGIFWMGKTLNNEFLKQYDTINMLSRYGNRNENKPIYASSPDHWHNNIIKCMSAIKGKYIPDNYRFRLK